MYRRRRSRLALATAIVILALPESGMPRSPGPGAQVDASAPAAQQARSRGSTEPASAWSVPRTAWGDPVIEGVYTDKDQQGIPLERPAEFGTREFLTADELAARAAQVQERIELDLADFDVSAGPQSSGTSPPPHWNDRGRPGRRTSRIVDPADGRIPALTAAGRQREAARAAARAARDPNASHEGFGLFQRCITRGLPGSMMPAVYGNSFQIVQSPSYVAIRYEMVHETRVIPLDRRPHVGPAIRQHMGDARGHWEADTLVVETTNFREDSVYRAADPDSLHLIERFTPVGPGTLEWAVTIEDSATWTRPWTFVVELSQDESQPVFEYACHEGNYAMFNLLRAARSAERDGREAPAPPGSAGR